MPKVSVNRLLAMEKSLRERLAQLNELKNDAKREFHWMKEDKTEKPTYDIKQVDKKIVQINKALFEINHRIKESNARTELEVDVDYDSLVSEIA
jgi:hypothetical protein